jgi:TetR/AcrR family transcriptional regulator
MQALASKSRMGSRGRPAESRAAILKAAVREFAQEGIAGARTDAIAKAAGVNKALLYYYFKDKEALYGAVLDLVFAGLLENVLPVFARDLAPGEKILAYVGAHFDYIASHPLYPRVVQGEMMRVSRGGSISQVQRVSMQYFHPMFSRIESVLQQGIVCGEFRKIHPQHFISSMGAVIVFYFTSAPVMKLMTGVDPMTPERIAERRAAVLDFISAALFRRQGSTIRLAGTSSKLQGARK